MLTLEKKKNHLIVKVKNKEFITIYSIDNKERLVIENRKNKILITHFKITQSKNSAKSTLFQ